MMKQVSDVVKTFFEEFERGSNTFERDLLTLLFIDPFMAADPDGGIQVVKKDDFLAGIANRHAFFQSLGFLFIRDDSPKIVFYTTHENLMTILQKSGLLPPTQETLSPDNSGTQ
jgi:hypothetical protein